VDGVGKGTYAVGSNVFPDLSADATIGVRDVTNKTNPLDGWFDEYRISKGIARWTSDFSGSLPSSEYIANLQCYSESSIKIQGSYSLKGIAVQTDSLNDTLTKSGLSLNLSDKDTLKIDFYAERTGTNLQLQIHDSGGTTSTKNIAISSADTWETTTWDISGIANADKDDIDEIIVKITNADSENTFYVDNFYAPGIINNMTLIANTVVAETEPDNASINSAWWWGDNSRASRLKVLNKLIKEIKPKQ